MVDEIVPLTFESGKELSVGMQKIASNDGLTPVFAHARKELLKSLLAERPDYDTVMYGVMERISYLHARVKQREQSGAYSTEQNYTMANKTLNDMWALLRKLDAEKEDRDNFKREFMGMVAEAVKYAIRDLDEEAKKNVTFLLQKRMESILNG